MNARKALRVLVLCTLAASLLLAAGCPASIYYTLENEVKTTDSSLSNDLWIHGMAKLGGAYYAAAGKVYKTTSITPVTWDTGSVVTPPQADAMCNAIVEFGGSLYGGFVNQAGSLGLYQSASATAFNTTPVAAFSGRQISYLGSVNAATGIAVVTADWDAIDLVYKYNLYVDATPSATTLMVANAAAPVTGVAYTDGGGVHDYYWAVTGSTLYRYDAGGPTLSPVTVTGAVAGEVFNSVFSDNEDNRLWVSSDKGYVYYSPDEGATWYRNATAAEVSGYTVSFLGIAGASGSSSMLVGAEGQSGGYGYWVVNVSGTTVTVTRFTESTIALYVASVRGFLVDGARVFAYTFGVARGLWRNEAFNSADCSVGAAWNQE
jgi:hypothetical protein